MSEKSLSKYMLQVCPFQVSDKNVKSVEFILWKYAIDSKLRLCIGLLVKNQQFQLLQVKSFPLHVKVPASGRVWWAVKTTENEEPWPCKGRLGLPCLLRETGNFSPLHLWSNVRIFRTILQLTNPGTPLCKSGNKEWSFLNKKTKQTRQQLGRRPRVLNFTGLCSSREGKELLFFY